MQQHMMKALWVGSLAVVMSAMIFGRGSEPVASTPASTELSALATMYKSADPYFLAALFKPDAPSAGAASAAPQRRGSSKADFSSYVLLHITRAESVPTSGEAD